MSKQGGVKWNKKIMAEVCFLLVLILYPMRHVNWGLDLMDTGYNYANFTYFGLEHMDSMWLYSTYLANAVGHMLTLLPYGKTLIGLNVYTGLFVSLLSVMGYLFCTRKLRIPAGIAFVGEFLAISLCWCPTALLYNYLTYVLFLGCVILLYTGLTEDKRWLLFAAGICLGVNVFVRFSNLPEAGMIVAVWAYAVIEGLEGGFSHRTEHESVTAHILFRAGRDTLWCISGYLCALLIVGVFIHIGYGLEHYVEGIIRLFAMTDTATDYQAGSMLTGLIYPYVDILYRVVRILVFVVVGMLGFAVAGLLNHLCAKLKGDFRNSKASLIIYQILRIGCLLGMAIITFAMLVWLYRRVNNDGYVSFLFYSYDSMYRPTVMFMFLTMVIGVITIFRKNSPKQEKLISGMVILVLILTSLGSNNNVYPSMNNLFVAAPYTLWQAVKFTGYVWNAGIFVKKGIRGLISGIPAAMILWSLIAMFLIHGVCFGAVFVFAEATGVQDISATMSEHPVLAGVKMSPERAEWIRELTAHIQENDLQDREVILYGDIPSISFYLQMPSAFNPWSDLPSYNISAMEQAMQKLCGEIDVKGKERPVVIAENTYALSEETGENRADDKWLLISQFMKQYGYEKSFSNEKFTVWQ